MAESHVFGIEAEEFAVRFLKSKGYCILHRNWKYGHKELDIICTDGRYLVVVEVKARRQRYFPSPEDLISYTKESFLLEAAEHYLYAYQVSLPLRIDLVSIIRWGPRTDIEHLEDVVVPSSL